MFLSLGAALISAVLILYVAYHGNKARSSISQYGIGVFNYTNQNTGNLSQFITAISDYRGEQDVEKKAAFKKEYLKRFDILWSAFVTLQQFQKDRTWPEISEFVTNSRQFAVDADDLMKPDVELSETHIQSLLKSTRELRQQNINLSNRHFQRQSSLRDDAAIRIRLLNRAYAALGAVLGIAVGSFLLLLWRARKRELKSTEELRTAHEQLTRVVEELRSGKVERKAQNRFVAAARKNKVKPKGT